MAVLANFSFIGLLAMGALAWGFARVLNAPQGAIRVIPLVMILIALLSQVALPEAAPFRQSVRGALIFGVYAAILAVPVLGYRFVLRRLRLRSGAAEEAPERPVGFVLIEEDARLVRDTAAEIARAHRAAAPAWAPEAFSVAHRDGAGRITGTARASVNLGLVDIDGLHVQEAALVPGLLGALEDAARARGARRACLTLHDWEVASLDGAAAQGYREVARLAYPDGAARITLAKDLA